MASMIACQPTRSKGQWAEYIQSSLIDEFTTNPNYEVMMQIIDFSYKNLPRHLKTCFLYIGIYPEDHEIIREELVRRWVAEGIVSCSSGHDVWDVAENCFYELVNRSMIQPVYEEFGNVSEVRLCRVHDMMLDLILRKCREDNFINLIEGPEMISEGHDKVIRRLTVNLKTSGTKGDIFVIASTRNLSQVRSLNIFRGNYMIPEIKKFKFLRVLFLDVYNLKMDLDLSCINQLSKLRYLKIVGGYGDKVLLPAQLQGLQVLQTLDLSYISNLCILPEMVDVPCLSHVFVPWREEVGLPNKTGNVKSLLTLSNFSLSKSSLESVTELGKLTALSELYLTFNKKDAKGMTNLLALIAALFTSLEKLGNLKKLNLISTSNKTVYCSDVVLSPFSPPFCKIEELFLESVIFSSVPKWISHLHSLRSLICQAKQVRQEDFNIIGSNLTSLIDFQLYISSVPMERIVIGGSTGFKYLKSFWFDCVGVSCLTFEAGAMSDLQELLLTIDPDEWDKCIPVGFQHLPNLKRINVYLSIKLAIVGTRETKEERKALVRSVFKEVVDTLPTCSVVCEHLLWRPKEIIE